VPKIDKIIEPDISLKEKLKHRREIYKETYKNLKEVFRKQ
jgi:hypothetical protein